MDRNQKAAKVLDILEKEFPEARSELDFSSPLELLIATILSAQATDVLVNSVTPALFRKYRSAADYAAADVKELEADISRVNFFRNKARNIKACCERIIKEHGGRVPDTLEALVELPGVGRKTANIVLGNAFGKDALAVDTHVKRVSQRLGLTDNEDPDKIEADLASVIPKQRWTRATHLMILHGRRRCKARGPDCGACPLKDYSVYYETVYKKKGRG